MFEKRKTNTSTTNELKSRQQTPLLLQFQLGWPHSLFHLLLSLSLSLSFPPPFIGSRISKSLVVKSAAALLCFACHARFWSTDGRRRNCVRWPQCRGMNIRPDISPPFLKVADLAPPHLPSYSCLPVEGGEDSKCGISSSALQPGHCCD